MNPSASLTPVALNDPGLVRSINAERVRLLFAHTFSVCMANIAFATAMALVVAHQVNAPMVWPWLAIKISTVIPRLLHLVAYRRSNDRDHPNWRRREILFIAMDGSAWGLAGWWLTPHDDLVATAMIAMSLCGATAVGVLVFQIDMACNLAYALPVLLPAALRFSMRGDSWGWFGSFGFATLLVLMIYEARRTERGIVELVSLRLITDRIAREREQALEEARRHSIVKDQFLANMSHELRTPLHGILGLTKLVAQREQDEESRHQLALVERSGRHLLTVVNDVLDFSKLEAGQLKVRQEAFDLRRLLEDVAALSTVNAQAKGLELITRIDLPRPCWVRGDPARVQQILHNLLGNAIKFTEAGHVEMHALRDPRSGHVAVSIEDTGVGIAPSELPRIFEAFHQADRSWGRRFTGTGLGLTISRKLSQAMGGDIVCMSTLGQGSRFTLTEPLPEVPPPLDTSTRPSSPAELQAEQATPPTSCRVLLAEDNPVNALVAQATLEQLGLHVTHVSDGQAAVDWIKGNQADIVLMDCQMPIMDGFEATRRIRAWEAERLAQSAKQGLGARRQAQHLPIIALTANAMETDRQRCLDVGMDDHLPKPFHDTELRLVLARHLGDANARTERIH